MRSSNEQQHNQIWLPTVTLEQILFPTYPTIADGFNAVVLHVACTPDCDGSDFSSNQADRKRA